MLGSSGASVSSGSICAPRARLQVVGYGVGGCPGVGWKAEKVAGGSVGEPAQPGVPDSGERGGAVLVPGLPGGVDEGGSEPGEVACVPGAPHGCSDPCRAQRRGPARPDPAVLDPCPALRRGSPGHDRPAHPRRRRYSSGGLTPPPVSTNEVLAELQRELIVANTHDGLQAARARGRRGKLTPQQATLAQQLYDTGEHTVQQIADIFGVPRTTVYGHLDQSTIGSRPGALTTANGNG